MAKPITHVVNVFSLSDIYCFFFNFVLFPTLCVACSSALMFPGLVWAIAQKEKKKLLRQCYSKHHCYGMLLTGAGQYNQKQNIINLKTESPALASSIIPRFINQN